MKNEKKKKATTKKKPKAENYYVRRDREELQQAVKMQRGRFRRYREQRMLDLA